MLLYYSVLAGTSQKQVVTVAGINYSQLSRVRLYKIYGYSELGLRKGQHPKRISMKENKND